MSLGVIFFCCSTLLIQAFKHNGDFRRGQSGIFREQTLGMRGRRLVVHSGRPQIARAKLVPGLFPDKFTVNDSAIKESVGRRYEIRPVVLQPYFARAL